MTPLLYVLQLTDPKSECSPKHRLALFQSIRMTATAFDIAAAGSSDGYE